MPGAIGEIELDEAERRLLLEQREAALLQPDVVVVVEIVEADDFVAALEQLACRVKADEAGRTGDENLHRLQPPVDLVASNTYLMS